MMDRGIDILQIVFADIILSGDNALVIGRAASHLSPELRQKAIFAGMALAAALRIFLPPLPGCCWKYRVSCSSEGCFWPGSAGAFTRKSPRTSSSKPRPHWRRRAIRDRPADNCGALVTITIADVSMSIDNVVAVAAIARDDTALLIFGLVLAIAFMAIFATMFMNVMTRIPALAWVGLVFLLYLTARMLHDGWPEVAAMLGIATGS